MSCDNQNVIATWLVCWVNWVNWLYRTCWCKGSLLLYWRKYIIWGIYINANSLIVCFIPLLYTTMNLFLPSVIVVSSQKLKILLMSNLTKYKISLWSSGGFISSGAEHHVYHGNKQWGISNPSLFISSVCLHSLSGKHVHVSACESPPSPTHGISCLTTVINAKKQLRLSWKWDGRRQKAVFRRRWPSGFTREGAV